MLLRSGRAVHRSRPSKDMEGSRTDDDLRRRRRAGRPPRATRLSLAGQVRNSYRHDLV